MFQRLLFFLQILIGMEVQEDDDMEVDAGQELVIIPVRDKGKDAMVGRYKRSRTKASMDTWNTKKWGHSTSTIKKKKRNKMRKRNQYFEC